MGSRWLSAEAAPTMTPNPAVERDAAQARVARLLAPLTLICWASEWSSYPRKRMKSLSPPLARKRVPC